MKVISLSLNNFFIQNFTFLSLNASQLRRKPKFKDKLTPKNSKIIMIFFHRFDKVVQDELENLRKP